MIEVKCDFAGVISALRACEERGIDPTPVLRKVGKEWNQEAREKLRAGGFAPLAPSTIEKRQNTGTSRITKFGNVRKSYDRRLDREAKRMQGLIKWTQSRYLGAGRFIAAPPDVQKKVAAWQKRLATLNRQIVRAQELEYAERKTGRSVAQRMEGRPILGRIPTSMFYKVKRSGNHWLLLVASHIAWSAVHNAGGVGRNGARIPQRQWLELTQPMLQGLANRLTRYLIAPLARWA